MEFYIYLFSMFTVVSIMLAIFGPAMFQPAGYKLPFDEKEMKKVKLRSFLANLFPFNQRVLDKIGLYQRIKYRLEAAHVNLGPIEFFNFKVLLILVLFVVTIIAMGRFHPWAVIGAIFAGYIIPDIWVHIKIKKRREAIVRRLPETVDLLGLCVEAGLDFTMAVRWLIEKTTINPMIEELRFVLEEIKWGKSRGQALKDMSRRLNIPEVSSFVQTLVQAERMGTPVSEAFMILSEDTRMRRFQRGERIALKAPIKILIPLIFCILPVIAIVIGGPILLQFMQNKLF
ncbi:MAG: type II secretion system F family protein [Candidatus Omnitrophica bacterium]|nr:type II secretion system F family protein [Candidatus Omnitrophota bacterium]